MIKTKNTLLTIARECGMRRYHVAGILFGFPVLFGLVWFVSMLVSIFQN